MFPPSITLTLRALLTLPYRLCNPPPSAGNVRSCKVTPLIKVSLDDVLNKRHLPPLTLKDFEEWLVFVEGCPQYLYFLLWLKEYENRYITWLAESGCELPFTPSQPKFASTTTLGSVMHPGGQADVSDSYINLIPTSATLALFFTRAKQTFLDSVPLAPYALGPDALAALVAANTPSTHSLSPSIPEFTIPPLDDRDIYALPPAIASHPHPHPRELAPLAEYARRVLKERLDRFAAGACHNVGTRRAWCGVAGGTFIFLLLGFLPILVTLFCARSRWWRVVGWLGCWLGGTIIVSSLHGICMMIYVFGDLRQLRSFELARPAISPPRAIARARPRLRSYFTRTPDVSAGTTESATGSVSPAASVPMQQRQAPPLRSTSQKNAKPVPAPTSETSTGTPVVLLEPGEVMSGTASEPTTAKILRTGTDSGPEKEEEDDCGFSIEISPAYYPEGLRHSTSIDAVERVQRAVQRLGVLESVRSGAGRVLTWVKRMSVSGSDRESHAGTFGVRSRLGSLSYGKKEDEEKSMMKDEEGDGATETDAEVFTADFIPRGYHALEMEDVEKHPVKEMMTPLQFDFDGLPLPPRMLPHPAPIVKPLTQPHTRSSPHMPLHTFPQPPEPALQPPAACIPPPLPPFASHGSLILAHTPPCSPMPTTQSRQWWDTCPRHPAVEATFALQSSTASQIQIRTSVPTFQSTSSTISLGKASWRVRFRRVMSVPAFGPLTRVLSPVVSRGQWEIVVRSGLVAALGAWMFVGCFVALPVVK